MAGYKLLIAIHASAGISAIFAFLLVFVELLHPREKSVNRAKIFSLLGTMLIFVSWLAGGYYYVTYYGSYIKPVIKEGPTPWIHGVIMETKEHVFLFLPFLSILALSIIFKFDANLLKNNKAKLSVSLLSALIVLIGLTIAAMGYLISAASRTTGLL